MLDRQLVNLGMEILKKAKKIDSSENSRILRHFDAYFDRVYEERESPVVDERLLTVTSHPGESIVMTIPTYRLYQIGRVGYVESYISQRPKRAKNRANPLFRSF